MSVSTVGDRLGAKSRVAVRSYEEELAAEQKYLDSALEARKATEVYSASAKYTAANNAELEAWRNFHAQKPRIRPNEPVAFGRVDPEDDDVLYIGKQSIRTADKDLLVISWKAPAAAPYYQATAGDKRGLKRKRTFEIVNHRLDRFDDLVFAELSEQLEQLGGGPVLDDGLLTALGAARNGEMADIVKTIQAAQDRIVRASRDQLLIVQGGPGTGKTAVALHRVSWLLYNYKDQLDSRDVLVIGPNPTFTRYIKKVLPDLGDFDVVQRSVQDFTGSDLRASAVDSYAAAALKGSSRMADVISAALDTRIRTPVEPISIRRSMSSGTVELSVAAVTAEIGRLRVQPYAKGRAMLTERLREMSVQEIRSRQPFSTAAQISRQSVDAEVEKLWPAVSGPQLIQELLGSALRLTSAGKGILTQAEVKELYRKPAKKLTEEKWTLADLALIDEAMESIGHDVDAYAHIVIDEAQDLSEMQLRAVRRRSRNGSMTIVGDIAQSTGPYARDTWEAVLQHLRSRLPHKIEELEEGYRVPKEVFEVARPVLEAAAPAVTAPRVLREAGIDPVFSGCARTDLAAEVASIASHHSGKGRFVGVVAPQELWTELRNQFKYEEMQWRESLDGELSHNINLVTPEDCKGLEFDAVVVVDPKAILGMPLGMRHLYIALTRTTTRLDVVYPFGTLPEILGGPDQEPTEEDPVSEEILADDELADAQTEPWVHSVVVPEQGSPSTDPSAPDLYSAFQQRVINEAARAMVDLLVTSYQPVLIQEILSKAQSLVRNAD